MFMAGPLWVGMEKGPAKGDAPTVFASCTIITTDGRPGRTAPPSIHDRIAVEFRLAGNVTDGIVGWTPDAPGRPQNYWPTPPDVWWRCNNWRMRPRTRTLVK